MDMVKAAFAPVTFGVNNILGIRPFYHIYGAVKLLLFPLKAGLPVAIMTRFDPLQFCEKYKITISLIVPPVMVVLARHPGTFISFHVGDRLLTRRKGKGPVLILQGATPSYENADPDAYPWHTLPVFPWASCAKRDQECPDRTILGRGIAEIRSLPYFERILLNFWAVSGSLGLVFKPTGTLKLTVSVPSPNLTRDLDA
ncbi:hypothetical protein BJ165DRAFT_1553573 [Panaeolus papilionaceus]|nr:hypothetical protein BJ165DRAFT_1553573 [Panaeolus papilionaceus]